MVGKMPNVTWLDGSFAETVKGWQSGWFYITEPRDTNWVAAPEFRSGIPTRLTSWEEKRASLALLPPLAKQLKEHRVATYSSSDHAETPQSSSRGVISTKSPEAGYDSPACMSLPHLVSRHRR